MVLVVHLCEGLLDRKLTPNLPLDRSVHLDELGLLFKLTLNALVGLGDVVRDSGSYGWHADFFHIIFKAIIIYTLFLLLFVGVGSPEACQELLLRHVGLLLRADPLKEYVQLLVSQGQLEAVDRIFELFEADRARIISVNQVKGF